MKMMSVSGINSQQILAPNARRRRPLILTAGKNRERTRVIFIKQANGSYLVESHGGSAGQGVYPEAKFSKFLQFELRSNLLLWFRQFADTLASIRNAPSLEHQY